MKPDDIDGAIRALRLWRQEQEPRGGMVTLALAVIDDQAAEILRLRVVEDAASHHTECLDTCSASLGSYACSCGGADLRHALHASALGDLGGDA